MRSKSYTIPINPISSNLGVAFTRRNTEKCTRDKIAFGLYLAQQHNDEPLFKGPVDLSVTFYLPPSKNIRKNKMQTHLTHLNLVELLRFLLNSMTTIIIPDHRVVCRLNLCKVYDKNPRTEFTVSEILP